MRIMSTSERTLLLEVQNRFNRNNGLSLFFAIICVIDVFGVFPVVTLPKVIINCGFYGILVIVVVCSIQIYTAALLGKCWVIAEEIYPAVRSKNRYPYSALAELTYGKCLSKCVNFLLDLTVFGGGIPNLIVASKNLELLGLQISNDNVNISYCYWIIILGMILCPILWLGSPRDMKCLCTVSVFMVFLVFLLTCSCLLFSTVSNTLQDNSLITNDIPLWKTMLTAYGIISFQFDIHPTILTIQVDMNDKSKLPKAVIGGFVITLCMFGTTTIIATLKYGMATQPSILDTLPTTTPLHFAAALIAIQLCLTSAVCNSALYQNMEDCLCISREFNAKRCVLRTILTVFAIVLAESVPRFDIVMALIGGTLTGPLVFILPPLFYIKILNLQTKHEEQLAMETFTNIVFNKETDKQLSKYMEGKFKEDFRRSLTLAETCSKWILSKQFEKVLCVLIIVFSSLATITTTYINLKNAVMSYSNLTEPCIYNISNTLLYL